MWNLPTAPRRSRLHFARAAQCQQQQAGPVPRSLPWPLSSAWSAARSLLPTTWGASGPAAAAGTRVSTSSAQRQPAGQCPPSLSCTNSARTLQPGPVPQAGQRANQAPRSDDPARENRSLETQAVGLRRSGSAAARGSTGRAIAPAPDAGAQGLCVGSAVEYRLQIRIRLPEILPIQAQRTLRARRWNLRNSNAGRHGCPGIAGGASQSMATSCAPVDLTDATTLAQPRQIGEIREPHGAYCHIQTARCGVAPGRCARLAGHLRGHFRGHLRGHTRGHLRGHRSGAAKTPLYRPHCWPARCSGCPLPCLH